MLLQNVFFLSLLSYVHFLYKKNTRVVINIIKKRHPEVPFSSQAFVLSILRT